MGLINKQTLIGICCASALLDLSESAIRKRLCGTDALTHVPKGNSARFSLILEEIVELKAEWIAAGKGAGQRSAGSSGNRLKLVV